MSHLILVRHSVSRPMRGVSAHEWALTDEGRARCGRLADHLRPYRIARVATSDEPKAQATGELLAQHLEISVPMIVTQDFGETRRETAPYYDSESDFRAAIRAAMRNPSQRLFGEESFTDARTRLMRGLFALVSQYPNETLAVVTHGTVMSLLLGHISGGDPYVTWQSLEMPAYAILTPNLDLLDLHPSVV